MFRLVCVVTFCINIILGSASPLVSELINGIELIDTNGGGVVGRIVGGDDAEFGQIPYQVSLRSDDNEHYCGGVILTNNWVTSAAHCTYDKEPEHIHIIVGTIYRDIADDAEDGDIYDIIQIVVNPDFVLATLSNDISLIESETSIVLTPNVQTVPIRNEFVERNADCTVAGWGLLSYGGSRADILQYLNVRTLDTIDCRARHAENNANLIADNNICTYSPIGEGMCVEDSGGPLVCDGELVGLVSWGVGCAQGRPDVFVRVYSHYDWIQDVTDL